MIQVHGLNSALMKGFNEPCSSDCTFIITFDTSSSNRSVNNLFKPVTGDGDTPAYTAKIVSTGIFGTGGQEKVKKTIIAYLVRSDYSPYSINVVEKITFKATTKGNTEIFGRENTDAGSIYAGYKGDNSISGPCTDVKSNHGIFIARGKINLPDSFDGTKLENVAQDCSIGDINIDEIITNAKTHKYGAITEVHSGVIKFVPEGVMNSWVDGPYYRAAIFTSNADGFNIFTAYVTNTYGHATLKLITDIYVSGSSSEDLKIIGIPEVRYQANHQGWWSGGEDPTREQSHISSSTRTTCIDLNGHSIYSDCNLKFGIDVIGKGRIFCAGNVNYVVGSNGSEIITACKGDLTIELSKTVMRNQAKGLYYAGGDINIKPFTNGSELWWQGDVEDHVKEIPGPYKGEAIKLKEPNDKEISIGKYIDPPPYYDSKLKLTIDPPPYYEGNGMIIKKHIDTSGNYKYIAEGSNDPNDNSRAPLELCLDYKSNKNISFGNYKIGIIPQAVPEEGPKTDRNFQVKFLNDYDNEISPQPDLSSFGITEEELASFASQIAYYYDFFSESVDININGTMGGKQNIIFEPGPYGNIHINFYPDYLNSIVNVQKKFFTVRKISCTEM